MHWLSCYAGYPCIWDNYKAFFLLFKERCYAINGFFIHPYVHWENLKMCSTDSSENSVVLDSALAPLDDKKPSRRAKNILAKLKKYYTLEIMVIKFTNISKWLTHSYTTQSRSNSFSLFTETSFHPSSLKSSINNLHSKCISHPRPPLSTAAHHAISRIKAQLSSH